MCRSLALLGFKLAASLLFYSNLPIV
jgi:hypothetical protein